VREEALNECIQNQISTDSLKSHAKTFSGKWRNVDVETQRERY